MRSACEAASRLLHVWSLGPADSCHHVVSGLRVVLRGDTHADVVALLRCTSHSVHAYNLHRLRHLFVACRLVRRWHLENGRVQRTRRCAITGAAISWWRRLLLPRSLRRRLGRQLDGLRLHWRSGDALRTVPRTPSALLLARHRVAHERGHRCTAVAGRHHHARAGGAVFVQQLHDVDVYALAADVARQTIHVVGDVSVRAVVEQDLNK